MENLKQELEMDEHKVSQEELEKKLQTNFQDVSIENSYYNPALQKGA